MKARRMAWMVTCLAAGIVASFLIVQSATAQEGATVGFIPEGISQSDVFVSGTEGYDTFRIPAILVTKQGTVLAFCEGRKGGRGDAGDIDIVLRRSTDGGTTWSAISVLWNDGPNTCGNPCVVQDEETGTIWLLLTHNLGEDDESEIWAGTSKSTRTVWVTKSIDDGVTWPAPLEITATTKKPEWSWYATGPGVGIQLAQGPHTARLVIPCDHGVLGGRDYHAHVIYSDDHGTTWQLGGSTPDKTSSECQVVELSDGRLLLDIRTHFAEAFRRKFSFSEDGGATWSDSQFIDELTDPHCQASLIRYAGPHAAQHVAKAGMLVFSNPASKSRDHMTVRLSFDDGKTWPISQLLQEGPSAYSCLAVMPNGSIGCLYERGDKHAYEKITLARIPICVGTGK